MRIMKFIKTAQHKLKSSEKEMSKREKDEEKSGIANNKNNQFGRKSGKADVKIIVQMTV